MPIRFRCKKCRQILGIATRKAGTEIGCPKCGVSQVVPSEEAALAALAMDQFATPPETAGAFSELVVYDDEPKVIESPRFHRGKTAGTPRRGTSDSSDTIVPLPGEPVPCDMILYSRRTLYTHGVLFAVLTVAAFALGYLIGRTAKVSEVQQEQAEAARQAVTIEGTLTYQTGGGTVQADQDAVIIVLPETKKPWEKKILVQDIGPGSPLPGEEPDKVPAAVREIGKLGGAYARADDKGEFSVVVPDQGDYFVLLISAHARRPPRSQIHQLHLERLGYYFTMPEGLIGTYAYDWKPTLVNVGLNPIKHTFGE